MSETLFTVYGIVALFGFAAVILWLIEGLARLIGGKGTVILLLGVIPSMLGAIIAFLNRAQLQWWELVLYPLAGPLVACGVLVLGYILVSPLGIPDMLGLISFGICRAVKALCRLAGWRAGS